MLFNIPVIADFEANIGTNRYESNQIKQETNPLQLPAWSAGDGGNR
jgi:hypothetical protein